MMNKGWKVEHENLWMWSWMPQVGWCSIHTFFFQLKLSATLIPPYSKRSATLIHLFSPTFSNTDSPFVPTFCGFQDPSNVCNSSGELFTFRTVVVSKKINPGFSTWWSQSDGAGEGLTGCAYSDELRIFGVSEYTVKQSIRSAPCSLPYKSIPPWDCFLAVEIHIQRPCLLKMRTNL